LVCTPKEFLKGLSCFTGGTRQIVLEGTSGEMARLLAPITQKPALEVESGYFRFFRKPKFIAISMTAENLEALTRVAEKHAGPEVFVHCHLISSSEILVEAHDTGAGVVLLSPLLPTAQIDDFVRLTKAKVEREEVSE
jgi:hypothetical protein